MDQERIHYSKRSTEYSREKESDHPMTSEPDQNRHHEVLTDRGHRCERNVDAARYQDQEKE